MRRNAVAIIITLAYPFVVSFGLGAFSPRAMAVVLGVVMLVRLSTAKDAAGVWWLAGAGLLILAVVVSNKALPLKLYPALVNAGLLALFGWGLYRPPTVVERIARRRHPDLPPAAVAYTRRVTIIWCVFFVVNGLIALETALWETPAVWSLYNGFIAYILMGVVFAGEWVVRQRVMRVHNAA